MSTILVDSESFEMLQCGECGINFFAPAAWVSERRDKGERGREFVCPNGHRRVWTVSQIDKIRRERDLLKQQMAMLEDEKRAAERLAEKEAKRANRIKRRSEAALCPCCNRHFSQLARHMKSKHSNIVPLEMKSA